MKQNKKIFVIKAILLILVMTACAPTENVSPTSDPTQESPILTINDIKANYVEYEGKLVSILGYGMVMMTAPLCPGYVGMDTRLNFMDATDGNIPAVVVTSEVQAERYSDVHEFRGYVRVFNGESGCPGSVQNQVFPFFEIVEVK
jgi:hypothetical protein